MECHAQETLEQRDRRLTRQREQYRERQSKARAEETPEQREQRLASRREQARTYQADITFHIHKVHVRTPLLEILSLSWMDLDKRQSSCVCAGRQRISPSVDLMSH